MIFLCLPFTDLQRTREICNFGGRCSMSCKPLKRNVPQKTTGLGFSRGLFKSPNLAGCFPPKPPARFLMHCDHRSQPKNQQEYRGNKREGLDRRGCRAVEGPQKRGDAKPLAQEKTLTASAPL